MTNIIRIYPFVIHNKVKKITVTSSRCWNAAKVTKKDEINIETIACS